jgi:ATP-binding cassette subfamily B protein
MVQTIIQKIRILRTNLNIKRTLTLVWSAAKSWMIISLVMILAETILFLSSFYALKVLIDKISNTNLLNKDHEFVILKYVIIAGAIAVLYAIARAMSVHTTEVQATKVANYIDEKIHHTAIQMDLSYYESPEYFDILKRAKDAGADRPNLVVTTMIEIIKNILNLCAVGSLFVTINWLLLPLLVLFILPTLFVRIYFADKQNTWRIRHTALERKSAYLSNLITSDQAAKEIRSFNLGYYFKDLYRKIRIEVSDQKLKISYRRTLNEILTTSIASIGFFTCIGYISLGTVSGKTSIGDIVLFLMAFPQAYTLMQNIASGISILYANNIFLNSLFELFDLHKEQFQETKVTHSSLETNIELKEVCFTYPHASSPTLNNINLSVPSGKIVAIVGLNGAGKSTLIKLLCRLYEPNSGQIMLNNLNANEFDLLSYRKHISVVFQDFVKYNVSAEDNIKFGDLDKPYDKEEIINAAQNSGAHHFIKNFPEGYNTMMGRLFDDGHEVSIGQWQKLAIARSLYSSANLLIFDEATSALDSIAEKELFDTFRKRINKRSALIISHRHSAVKHADYIYVLSGGKISQHGTDQELLAQEGDYARLFKEESLNSSRI